MEKLDYSRVNIEPTKKRSLYPRLIDDFIGASKIEEDDLVKVDDEIKLQINLINKILEGAKVTDKDGNEKERKLNNDEIKNISTLAKQIVSSKEVRHKIEKQIKLDVTNVREFTIQVLKVVKKNVPDHQAKKVMEGILQIIGEFRETKRIEGLDNMDNMAQSIKTGADLNG